ncbi:gliding motility-associated lipoprotein GldD [Emticicia oligotrophica DSM 17448]|uniref:Gliding motility-associated lipoprotein GldD n=1 Tax=Emticicia oligotrophica (strain DSM 17448 / CIP 109782 / MTCC 6937 / GPTSA100-15) TaxID=929562 RepID=A0ABM5MY28_EMTOG|nr:gliding motility lipoprotein GldD [Emticicia oligotrophica]AFK01832.1 gliding motility-associated lipoprotein GldD [Emticicia oligotrophica DSM 17448]
MGKVQFIKLIIFIALFIISLSCSQSNQEYTPKPRGFNRIDLPEHQYQLLPDEHPYSFEYSKDAIIQLDTFKGAEPHWIIVYYPKLNSRIQFTYKAINNDISRLQNMMIDASKLAFHHDKKAYSITDKIYLTKNGKKAVIFELEGEVPSPYQFFVTDSTKHYLRGAVYLMTATENDSLRPIIDYMKVDTKHILETLKWK